jgi:hypothetical protein
VGTYPDADADFWPRSLLGNRGAKESLHSLHHLVASSCAARQKRAGWAGSETQLRPCPFFCLTTPLSYYNLLAEMKTYSTREAAKLLSIHIITLQKYIAARKITVPPVQHIGGTRFRAWTLRDVERVRKSLLDIKPKNGRRRKK